MSQEKPILFAFFIPFALAVGFWALRVYVFLDPCDPSPDGEISFGVYDCVPLIQSQIFSFLAGALFFLSLALPFGILTRKYEDQRDKSQLKLNI